MATDYTIPKDEYRALVAERDKLLDGFHAMQQLYEDELKHALAENAKLREELAKARDPQRIGGQADPSSFVYAIEQLREFRWQHATNDEDAIPYINNVVVAHERENAKLRELVRDMAYCNQCWRECDECRVNGGVGTITERAGCDALLDRMRELGIGIEVGE